MPDAVLTPLSLISPEEIEQRRMQVYRARRNNALEGLKPDPIITVAL